MYPARQTFLVLGLSRSGCAAAEFLLERKAKVFIYDDVPGDSVEKAAKLLTEKGAERVEKDRLSACTKFATHWCSVRGFP